MTICTMGSSEYGDTWYDSGYIFQVKTTSFADRLDVCWEGKDGVQDDFLEECHCHLLRWGSLKRISVKGKNSSVLDILRYRCLLDLVEVLHR